VLRTIDVKRDGPKHHLGVRLAQGARPPQVVLAVPVGKQLFGRAGDCQAVFQSDITIRVLLKKSAPIFLTRRRMMRIDATAILLVKRTGLPKPDLIAVGLLDRQAEVTNQPNVFEPYRDARVQRAITAQATRQTQLRVATPAVGDSIVREVRPHRPNIRQGGRTSAPGKGGGLQGLLFCHIMDVSAVTTMTDRDGGM
jgi:hypothetical protein